MFTFDLLDYPYSAAKLPARSWRAPSLSLGLGWNVSVGGNQYQDQTDREKIGSGYNIDLAICSRAPEVIRGAPFLLAY